MYYFENIKNWLADNTNHREGLKVKAESLKQKGNSISIRDFLARKNNPVINNRETPIKYAFNKLLIKPVDEFIILTYNDL